MREAKPDDLRRGKNKRTFLYRQLSKILRQKIKDGAYQPGDRIPSMDDLARAYELNKATVRSALAELAREGLLYSVPAQGTFVAEPISVTLAPTRSASLTVGVMSVVMIPNDTGPFHLALVETIRKELWGMQANLMSLPMGAVAEPLDAVRMVADAGLDAVFCVGPFDHVVLDHLSKMDLPAVLLDYAQSGLRMDTICMDNTGGAEQAMQYLLELGHTRLAVIAGEESQPVTSERIEGALRAVSKAGRARGEVQIEYGDYTREGGAVAMKRLLASGTPPTAVFCMNDEMAAGAMQAVRGTSDLRIPRDISFVGFDDVALAAHLYPPLTTVQAPTAQMGRLGAERLREQLACRESCEQYVPGLTMLATTLIHRDSTVSPSR